MGEEVREPRRANVQRITNALCDESWAGRWSPLDETNIRPLAEHTAVVLDRIGCTLAVGEGDSDPTEDQERDAFRRSSMKILAERYLREGVSDPADEIRLIRDVAASRHAECTDGDRYYMGRMEAASDALLVVERAPREGVSDPEYHHVTREALIAFQRQRHESGDAVGVDVAAECIRLMGLARMYRKQRDEPREGVSDAPLAAALLRWFIETHEDCRETPDGTCHTEEHNHYANGLCEFQTAKKWLAEYAARPALDPEESR